MITKARKSTGNLGSVGTTDLRIYTNVKPFNFHQNQKRVTNEVTLSNIKRCLSYVLCLPVLCLHQAIFVNTC